MSVTPLNVNGARGEVPLKIDDVELVIAATMEGLAALSTKLQCQSLADLWGRLSAMEVNAVLAGINTLTVKGDKSAALAVLKIKHFKACQNAFIMALNHQIDGEEGNEDAAEEKTKASPGGNGNSSLSAI